MILTVAHGKMSQLSLLERSTGYTTDGGASAFSVPLLLGGGCTFACPCLALRGIAWQFCMKGEGVAVLRSRYCVAWKGSRTPNTPAECEQWLFCSRVVASSILDSILARRICVKRKKVACVHMLVKQMFFSDAFDQSHALNPLVQFFSRWGKMCRSLVKRLNTSRFRTGAVTSTIAETGRTKLDRESAHQQGQIKQWMWRAECLHVLKCHRNSFAQWRV